MSVVSEMSVAPEVRKRVFHSRDRFWHPEDFHGSPDAVAQALSRLARSGELRRVRRGLYWRGAPTRLGMAPPPSDRFANEVIDRTRHRPRRLERSSRAWALHASAAPRDDRSAQPRATEHGHCSIRQPCRKCQTPGRASPPCRGRSSRGAPGLGHPRRGPHGRRRRPHSGSRREWIASPRSRRARFFNRATPCSRAASPSARRPRAIGGRGGRAASPQRLGPS